MANLRTLPISEYQKRFFLEWVLAPNESTYNISVVYKINGKLDQNALKEAFRLIINKNEIFHARYNEDGSNCYFENYSIDDFYHVNFTEKNIQEQLRQILDIPFDLTKDVLCRFYLLINKEVLNRPLS